jgi:hypothetical protein
MRVLTCISMSTHPFLVVHNLEFINNTEFINEIHMDLLLSYLFINLCHFRLHLDKMINIILYRSIELFLINLKCMVAIAV